MEDTKTLFDDLPAPEGAAPSAPKAGAAGTLLNVVQDGRLNHQLEVTSGVLAAESAEVIREFFRTKRGE